MSAPKKSPGHTLAPESDEDFGLRVTREIVAELQAEERADPKHVHQEFSHKVTHSDEHGTRTVYTCSCGMWKTIERLPRGSWLASEWHHYESAWAG